MGSMNTRRTYKPKHREPKRNALLTKHDVASALLNGLVGLVATVIGGLIVVVLEHCLY